MADSGKKNNNKLIMRTFCCGFGHLKFTQLIAGGVLTFITKYGQKPTCKEVSSLDKDVEDAALNWQTQMVPTGKYLSS